MFAVYAGQHMSELEPEPEAMGGIGAPTGDPGGRADSATLHNRTSSSDDGEDKI